MLQKHKKLHNVATDRRFSLDFFWILLSGLGAISPTFNNSRSWKRFFLWKQFMQFAFKSFHPFSSSSARSSVFLKRFKKWNKIKTFKTKLKFQGIFTTGFWDLEENRTYAFATNEHPKLFCPKNCTKRLPYVEWL